MGEITMPDRFTGNGGDRPPDRGVRFGSVIGCLTLFLIAALAFLYLTFPFDRLQIALVEHVAAQSGCRIDVQKQAVRFPFRMTWEGVRADCSAPGSPYVIATIDADVAPLPLLWGGEAAVDFKIVLAEGGNLVGRATVKQTNDGLVFSLAHQADAVDLKQVGASGRLSSNGEWRQLKGETLGQGHLSLTLDDLKIDRFGTPGSSIGTVSFKRVDSRISWRGDTITFDRIVADGNRVEIESAGGRLLVREPFGQSRLFVTLQVTPKGDLQSLVPVLIPGSSGKEPITVTLSGALAQPSVLVNGKPLRPSAIQTTG